MKIRPIRTAEELDAIHKIAEAENHPIAWPTHVMEKNNYVIGTMSIMPMALVWLSTQRAQVRDTLFLNDHLEAVMANTTRVFCVPCTEDSPLLKVISKPELGYIKGSKPSLYFKGV